MTAVPDGWEVTTIGEIVLPFDNVNPRKQPDATFVYVDIGSIDNQTQEVTNPKKIKGKEAPSRARRQIKTGDTLFSTVRTYLKNIALVTPALNSCITSTGIAVLRPCQAIDPKYLFNFARSPEFLTRIGTAMDGTMYPAVTDGDVLAQDIPLPPLAEQRRIVAKLDALFARTRQAREELEHIPTLIEHYKQAILAAAFRGELTADWRNNNACDTSLLQEIDVTEGHDRFSPPFDIPTGWRWIPLPKLGDLGRGKSRHRPRNDPSLYDGPYPFVQTGEIRAADGFLTTFEKTYNETGLAQSKLWPVGTVCITIAANIAETTILGIEACFPDSVVGLITDDAICLNRYAEYFLRTVREELDAFAPATAQKNINLGTLSQVYIPIPPREEQDEIVRLVDDLYDSISKISLDAEQANRMLDYLERAVLAKAFRGELVPQDPDDEPASVLLERIRAARAEGSNGNKRKKRG